MPRLIALLGVIAACLLGGCAARQVVVPSDEQATADDLANETANVENESARPLRGVVLSIGRHHREDGWNLIGWDVLAADLNDAITLLPLDIEPGDVVVLLVDSQGGTHAEAMRIARIVRQRLVPTYQTVAWIQLAFNSVMIIPAAVDRVVMMPDAHWGFVEGFTDRALEPSEWPRAKLDDYEKFSGFSSNDRAFLRAATISCGLSASRIDGKVVLFPDGTTGELQVAREQGWPAFLGAPLSQSLELSEGTAKTLEELEDTLGLGEIEWAGQQPANEWWPLSHAERLIRERMHQRDREFQRKQEEEFRRRNAALKAELKAKAAQRAAEKAARSDGSTRSESGDAQGNSHRR